MTDRVLLLVVSIAIVGWGVFMIVRADVIARKRRENPPPLLGEAGRRVADAQRPWMVVQAGVAFAVVGVIGAVAAVVGLVAG